MSAADAAGQVVDLLVDIAAIVADERIDGDTAINLVTRAHRAIRPRAQRLDSPHKALAALRQTLRLAFEEPYCHGRPASGVLTPVRLTENMWTAIDGMARAEGYVCADGSPVRAQMIRALVDEALAARKGQSRHAGE